MIHVGDCLEVMAGMEAESVDAIVTDPPYGLSFMGKDWDHGVPGEAFWREALRVAKPGTHLLAFGGSRTYHRLTVAIEDAGWEVRDCIMWVYGSGFPKSLNLADKWQGWGTALKPAYEPIVLARKPIKGTVAANVQEYGTGAVNIDGCRVEGNAWVRKPGAKDVGLKNRFLKSKKPIFLESNNLGRWPANFIHDGSDEVTGLFPQAKSPAGSTIRGYGTYKTVGGASNHRPCHDSGLTRESVNGYGDSGSAARFFYCAKASKADRDGGCEGIDARPAGSLNICTDSHSIRNGMNTASRGNHHPTVKPNALMRYLCRLVTPPGGIVLDPFCGSGSTGKAAIMEGFRFIGIELNPEYAAIAQARIDANKPFVEQTENENEPRQLCLIYP